MPPLPRSTARSHDNGRHSKCFPKLGKARFAFWSCKDPGVDGKLYFFWLTSKVIHGKETVGDRQICKPDYPGQETTFSFWTALRSDFCVPKLKYSTFTSGPVSILHPQPPYAPSPAKEEF